MSQKRTIQTSSLAPAVGPFSHGTTNGDLVFTSGQIAVTADGESLTEEPINIQTEQCLENIAAVLEEAGGSLADVLKITVFLDDIESYETMNDAYEQYFDENPPARTAIEVAKLPLGAGIEMQAIAAIESP